MLLDLFLFRAPAYRDVVIEPLCLCSL